MGEKDRLGRVFISESVKTLSVAFQGRVGNFMGVKDTVDTRALAGHLTCEDKDTGGLFQV